MAIERDDVYNLAMKPTFSQQRKKIAILGVGGVGSNLVRQIMPLQRNRKVPFNVSIYDHDTVELHNLNRTSMFSVKDAFAGVTKVNAIKDMCSTVARLEIARYMQAITKENFREIDFLRTLIVDSRDTMAPNKIIPGTWLKLAYDGGSDIGFTWLPHVIADKIFDLSANVSNTYAVTPSFYVPAAILSAMTLRFMQFYNFLDITELRAGTFQCNIDSIINEVTYQWTPAEEVVEE
jgi:hypothetical protein